MWVEGDQLDYVDLIGWAAATFTIAAYAMKTMIPFRITAMCANALFVVFGALNHIYPTFFLNFALLAFNAFRLIQLRLLVRQVRQAANSDVLPSGIKSYFRHISVPPDGYVFRKGDSADFIYLLEKGEICLEEIGVQLPAGEIFGEVAFFSPSRRRTLSARCIGKCDVRVMDETEFMALFYQKPEFGFFVVRVMGKRLEENTHRSVVREMLVQAGSCDPGPDGSSGAPSAAA